MTNPWTHRAFWMAAATVLLLAGAQVVAGATDPVPWTHGGSDASRDGFSTTPYALPWPPVSLGTLDVVYPVTSTPLAVDLDGDSDLELVVATDWYDDYWFSYVYAYDWNGAAFVEIWSVELPVSVSATTQIVRLAAGNVTGDATPEVIAWSASYSGGGPSGSKASGRGDLVVISGAGTTVATITEGGFDLQGGHVHPAVADVDGDGINEIMVVEQGPNLHTYDASTGSLSKKWFVNFGTAGVGGEFAVAELDASHPGMEIVVATDVSSTSGYLWTCRPTATAGNCGQGATSAHGPFGVALVDMDGDGTPEAVTGGRSTSGDSGHSVYTYDGTNYNFKAGRKAGYTWNTPSVGDVNRDGQMDFVNGFDHNFPDITDYSGHVYASTYNGATVGNLGTVTRTATPVDDYRLQHGGALGNIVGDENLEYVYTDTWGDIRIISFDASGAPSLYDTITSDSFASGAMMLADLNGDCALDIVAGFDNGDVWIFGDDTPRFIPEAVRSLAGTENGTAATLTWDEPAYDGDRPVIAYNIYRAPRGGTPVLLDTVQGTVASPPATSYVDNGTLPGPDNAFAAEVDYTVTAVNCMGESPNVPVIELDVHQPPVQQLDVGITLPLGTSANVTTSLLNYTDDLSNATQLRYTVTAAPAKGQLYHNVTGTLTPINLGDTFNQSVIDAGQIAYHHAGADADPDGFNFTVADHHGKTAAEARFNITVLIVNDLSFPTAGTVSVIEGMNATVTGLLLRAADPGATPAQLVFTLGGDAGTLGVLRRDGTDLQAGDTFTQQDINDGLIRFHANLTTGTVNVPLRVTNPIAEEETGNLTITVTPATSPDAFFTISNPPYYHGLTVTFTDSSTRGTYPIVARSWCVDGFDYPDDRAQVGIGFSTPGTYDICLEVTDAIGRSDTHTRTIEVDELVPTKPQFRMTKDVTYVGEMVTFYDTSVAGSIPLERREWDFSDAGILADQDPVIGHAFGAPGVYQVTLIVIDEMGFRYYATHSITVNPAPPVNDPAVSGGGGQPPGTSLPDQDTTPIADAGPDQLVLQGTVARLNGSASLSKTGLPLRYVWTHVSGTEVDLVGADTATPMFAVPWDARDETEALFRLVVHDGHEQSVPDLVRVVIHKQGKPSLPPVDAPSALFHTMAEADGMRFQPLDHAIPGLNFTWSFAGGTPVHDTEPLHAFEAPGTYPVRLTVRDAFGRETANVQQIVVEEPETETVQGGPAFDDTRSAAKTWIIVVAIVLGITLAGALVALVIVLRRRGQASSAPS